MFKYLIFEITVLLFSCSHAQGFGDFIQASRFEKHISIKQIYGELTEKTGVKTSVGCVVHCLTHADCKGAVFHRKAIPI